MSCGRKLNVPFGDVNQARAVCRERGRPYRLGAPGLRVGARQRACGHRAPTSGADRPGLPTMPYRTRHERHAGRRGQRGDRAGATIGRCQNIGGIAASRRRAGTGAHGCRARDSGAAVRRPSRVGCHGADVVSPAQRRGWHALPPGDLPARRASSISTYRFAAAVRNRRGPRSSSAWHLTWSMSSSVVTGRPAGPPWTLEHRRAYAAGIAALAARARSRIRIPTL